MEWYARALNPLRTRYLKFIMSGLLQGVISYFVLGWIAHDVLGDINVFLANILSGVIISALVFGVLLRTPRWLQSLGFIVVGIMLPVAQFEADLIVRFGTLAVPDGLTTLMLVVWTAALLPFSIIIGVIYFLRQ